MKRHGPDYWKDYSLDDVKGRVINRAERLARLLVHGAPPIVVANEKFILDEAYDEYQRRTGATPTFGNEDGQTTH